MRILKYSFLIPLSVFLMTLNSANAAAAADTHAKSTAKIDLNSATEAELKELPGVGDVTAKKIVSNRPYKSVQDLSKAGLSENQITKISSQVTVKKTAASAAPAAGKSTAAAKTGKVDINTASSEELEALPGVGPVSAKKIIDNRPYASAADLKKSGLPAGTLEKVQPLVTASKPSASRPAARKVETSAKPAPAASTGKSSPSATSKGQVWLNTDTNIFHREGDRWYGKTKSGKFVSEEEALRLGAKESMQH